MHLSEHGARPVLDELEKILASPGFARNERLSHFLRFIVQRELEGKGIELKESLIGVGVFERKSGYDPKQDSIVRTEAAKLRDRSSKYYVAEGAGDPIVIEFPKGGYVPVFRRAETQIPKHPWWLLLARPWSIAALVAVLLMWDPAVSGGCGTGTDPSDRGFALE